MQAPVSSQIFGEAHVEVSVQQLLAQDPLAQVEPLEHEVPAAAHELEDTPHV